MKRIIIPILAFFLFISLNTFAQPKATLKKVLELKMPKTADDDKCGTRGASVVWHPKQKKYYASFAGNTEYPFAIFDVKGKRLSEDDLTALSDVRGLWYNSKKQTISGNAYSDGGWFNYTLNEKGMIDNSTVDIEGMNQPGEQSVGIYHPTRNEVLFLDRDLIVQYTNDGMTNESRKIHFGTKANSLEKYEDEITPEDYNYTSLIYTGIKNMEIGALNVSEKQIELYDFEKGYLKKILVLPTDTPVEGSFNFAYANGLYWLFNIEKRTWIGLK